MCVRFRLLEAIVALCAVLTLVVIILGGLLKALRDDQKNIWVSLNNDRQRQADFREEVIRDYMRKSEVEEHISLRLDSINDRMERTEIQLEQISTSLSGFNQLLPSFVEIMSKVTGGKNA